MSKVEISDDAVRVWWGRRGGRHCDDGAIVVRPDGSLYIEVDDDFYNGEIEPAHALQLAEAIRVRARRT